jgi:hypothetical protein
MAQYGCLVSADLVDIVKPPELGGIGGADG